MGQAPRRADDLGAAIFAEDLEEFVIEPRAKPSRKCAINPRSTRRLTSQLAYGIGAVRD